MVNTNTVADYSKVDLKTPLNVLGGILPQKISGHFMQRSGGAGGKV